MNGGKDVKREMDTPKRSQENSAAKGSNTTRKTQANASQDLADMADMTAEQIDSLFDNV